MSALALISRLDRKSIVLLLRSLLQASLKGVINPDHRHGEDRQFFDVVFQAGFFSTDIVLQGGDQVFKTVRGA